MNGRHFRGWAAAALALSLAGFQGTAIVGAADVILAMGPDPGGKRGTAFDPDSIRTDHPGLKEPPIDPATRGPVVNGATPPDTGKPPARETKRPEGESRTR